MGLGDVFKGRAAIQGNLDRARKLTHRNLIKFNKGECRHGWHRLGGSLAERDLEVLVASKVHMNQPCPLAAGKAGNMLSYVNRTIACRSKEVIYTSTQHWLDNYNTMSNFAPCPQSKEDSCKLDWVQEEAMKVVGAGTQVLWGEAEGAGLVQAGTGEALRGLNRSLPVPVRRLLRSWSWALRGGAWQDKGQWV